MEQAATADNRRGFARTRPSGEGAEGGTLCKTGNGDVKSYENYPLLSSSAVGSLRHLCKYERGRSRPKSFAKRVVANRGGDLFCFLREVEDNFRPRKSVMQFPRYLFFLLFPILHCALAVIKALSVSGQLNFCLCLSLSPAFVIRFLLPFSFLQL